MPIKIEQIKKILPILVYQRFNDEASIVVSQQNLLISLTVLSKHLSYQYKVLSCISGVDILGKKYRFSVVYDLLSLTFSSRLRVKVFVNEITSVPSVVSIYMNANWWEREIWDLYGIYFDKHPDLRRILTDYGFEGNPMKKDFPQTGFVELRYNESKKRIVTELVELSQEFRLFTFETPW